MKILIFTEGTILMHKNAKGKTREERVSQVRAKNSSVSDYDSYIPIGNAVDKIKEWKKQGAEIYYLTSRKTENEVRDIQKVLQNFQFSDGKLLFRKDNEAYKDVAEKLMPDVLIEDDCESIGGMEQTTIFHVSDDKKKKIKSILVKEFGGIDHLETQL